MVNFFRKLRFSNLNKGKFFHYLKYAIGEIVLVVIGILIALQINTWNEQRKQDNDEKQALVNIKQDFSYNKKLLQEVLTATDDGIQSCLNVLKYTGSKPKPEREQYFDSLLNKVSIAPYYYPRNGFLDDLINSGKLSLFKNLDLRNRLSSWKPMVDRLQERYDELSDYQHVMNDFIIEHGCWLNADEVITIERSVQFPKSGFDKDNRDLLGYIEFENLMENNAIYLDNYRGEIINTRNLLDRILNILDNELKSKS